MIKQVANFSGGGGGAVAWDDVTGKPSTFTPSSHTHVQADITDLAASKAVIAKVKTARETVTSSNTLQDDDHFVFAVEANKTYRLEGSLLVSAAAAGGWKWVFSVPSGTTGRASQSVSNSAVYSSIDFDATAGFGVTSSSGTTGNGTEISVFGYLTTSSTAGDIVFRWAQNGFSATGTYIERTSTMTLTEV